MGRIFETRKHKMFARWDKMGKAFTRIGKEIAIAVKAGGPDPDANARLRTIIKNAKALNMPKSTIDNAIKRANSKDQANYEEVTFEGYGVGGVGIYVECATDNNTRSVANIRSYFAKFDGAMGKSGSLDFIFERKGVFKIKNENINAEELEFELIDFGCEEFMFDDEEGVIIFYTPFADFGKMTKALEDKNINVISAELQRIPHTLVDCDEATAERVLALVDRIEQDDDVQQVFHNMK
jgi:YebC/PmpR family DNA-binding regulatory protein